MENLNVKPSDELLELLSSAEVNKDQLQEIRSILKSRGVVFEEFDEDKSSNGMSLPVVSGLAIGVFILIFQIIKMLL